MPRSILEPAPYITEHAIAFVAGDGSAASVGDSQPLPVVATIIASAASALSGSAATAGVVGPFAPQLGRAIWITLSGTWAGSAQLLRSTDGGVTKLPITYGNGGVKGLWTGNVNTPVAEETVAGASYWLSLSPISGAVPYRVEQ